MTPVEITALTALVELVGKVSLPTLALAVMLWQHKKLLDALRIMGTGTVNVIAAPWRKAEKLEEERVAQLQALLAEEKKERAADVARYRLELETERQETEKWRRYVVRLSNGESLASVSTEIRGRLSRDSLHGLTQEDRERLEEISDVEVT